MNMCNDALDPTDPTPQHFGFPENAKPEQLQVWFRQEAFLEAYAKRGKIGKAAKASGITRWCVDKWLQNDVYAIKKRMADAHADYVESLGASVVCHHRRRGRSGR
jgi:hypothetical protein